MNRRFNENPMSEREKETHCLTVKQVSMHSKHDTNRWWETASFQKIRQKVLSHETTRAAAATTAASLHHSWSRFSCHLFFDYSPFTPILSTKRLSLYYVVVYNFFSSSLFHGDMLLEWRRRHVLQRRSNAHLIVSDENSYHTIRMIVVEFVHHASCSPCIGQSQGTGHAVKERGGKITGPVMHFTRSCPESYSLLLEAYKTRQVITDTICSSLVLLTMKRKGQEGKRGRLKGRHHLSSGSWNSP